MMTRTQDAAERNREACSVAMPPAAGQPRSLSGGTCHARPDHVVRDPRRHPALRRPRRCAGPRGARGHPCRPRGVRGSGAAHRSRDRHAPARRLHAAAPSPGCHARAGRSPGCLADTGDHDLRDARVECGVLGRRAGGATGRRRLPPQVPCRAAHRRGPGRARGAVPPAAVLHPDACAPHAVLRRRLLRGVGQPRVLRAQADGRGHVRRHDQRLPARGRPGPHRPSRRPAQESGRQPGPRPVPLQQARPAGPRGLPDLGPRHRLLVPG